MRYSPEHKKKTQERILTVAGRLFRRHGYEGVGIDSIMAAAGLTRGGFYGYFPSKAALFAEALGTEHDFVRRMRARAGGGRRQLAAEAEAVVAGYLDPANRERVGRGCYLASTSPDVARVGGAAKRAYEVRFRELVAEFTRALPDARADDPRALRAIALCVGGLALSRAVDDEKLAGRIEEACRVAAQRELTRRRAD